MTDEPDNSSPIRAAHEELRRQGFEPCAQGAWTGTLHTTVGNIAVEVSLPPGFPHCLPAIRVDRAHLSHRVPHVESSGKICLPEGQGTIIDSSRPVDVVTESLNLARAILESGLTENTDAEFVREFLSYWGHDASGTIHSICTADGMSGQICLLQSQAPWQPSRGLSLLADTHDVGREWLKRAGEIPLHTEPAWLFRLSSAFIPPDFGARMTTREFLNIVRANSIATDYECFRVFTHSTHLPITAAFSMPANDLSGSIIGAVRFERPYGDNKKEAMKGFRPGKVPAWKEFGCTSRQSITRLAVTRLDKGFLLPRGGADVTLTSKKVLIVGVGSVGSRLAEKLAVLGVGTLRLVDNDHLAAENIHRHILGVESLLQNKALAMGRHLEKRFPHITVEANELRIEGTADMNRLIDGVDLVCIALGDETLELRLNDVLTSQRPRLHVWVEPIGVGGHVLLTGFGGPGCFKCLFACDERFGLHNKSSFSAPGQRFAKSFSGCAGTFTPFSGLDADRIATEAAELAARILLGQQSRNVLVSRFGNPADFLDAGFSLSDRARLFTPGEVRKVSDFVESSCHCSTWGAT